MTNIQSRAEISRAVPSARRESQALRVSVWMSGWENIIAWQVLGCRGCEDLTMTPTLCVGQRVSACFRSPG